MRCKRTPTTFQEKRKSFQDLKEKSYKEIDTPKKKEETELLEINNMMQEIKTPIESNNSMLDCAEELIFDC